MPVQPLKELNERHERFCRAYVDHLKKKQAAIDAGFSAKTSDVIASQLLRDPLIKARIVELRNEMKEHVGVFDGHVIRTWTRIMMANISDFGWFDGHEFHLRSWDNVHNDDLHAIKKLDQDTTFTQQGEKKVKLKIEFFNKLEAADMLARHFGMYEKDNKQRYPDMDDPTQSAQEKVAATLFEMATRVRAAGQNGQKQEEPVENEN